MNPSVPEDECAVLGADLLQQVSERDRDRDRALLTPPPSSGGLL